MKHVLCYSLLILGILICSCQPDTVCRQTNLDVRMACKLRADSITAAGQTIYYTTWDSITVRAVGSDSLVHDNAKNIERLLLPLRDNTDTTTFLLTYHEQTDTLRAYYGNRRIFVSVECGCVYYHDIDSLAYTTNWIDTILVIHDEVRVGSQENLRLIHHHHAENDE